MNPTSIVFSEFPWYILKKNELIYLEKNDEFLIFFNKNKFFNLK